MNLLKDLFEKHGSMDYIAEPVTQTQHMLQCGLIAYNENMPDYIIVACFLHDIGHLVGADRQLPQMIQNGQSVGIENHETIGAEYLQSLHFNDKICSLVANHVNTKRYFAGKNKEYIESLSEGSRRSLQCQGGPFTTEMCETYEKDPLFPWHVKLREIEDRGKDLHLSISSEDLELMWALVDKSISDL